MLFLSNSIPDTNSICHLSLFTMLNLMAELTSNSGPNSGPDPGANLGSNLGLTTCCMACKKPVVQSPTHKPPKAGPWSRQRKRIHNIFGAPLKIYNLRHTAILHAQQKARKNRAIPKEANVAGHNRKLQRSRPGSIILISSWTNPYDCITRNLLLSKGYWDVHSTSQFHEIGP